MVLKEVQETGGKEHERDKKAKERRWDEEERIGSVQAGSKGYKGTGKDSWVITLECDKRSLMEKVSFRQSRDR